MRASVALWFAVLATTAAAQDVLVLGEVHDNPGHHVRQAGELVRLRPRAVVWEMLTPAQAQAAEGTDKTPDAIAEATEWAGSGWPEFALYAPVFAAAPDARIYGAGVPRAQARRAFADGAAAVLDDPRVVLAPLDAATQTAREAEQMEAHCDALPAAILPGMVEAQRLRDGALAAATLDALAETGGPVAIITGNGHARRDWGVPALLEAASPDIAIVSLGQFEDLPEAAIPYDRWAVSPAPVREDPCAAFADTATEAGGN